MTYLLQDGTDLIAFARKNIQNYLSNGKRLTLPEDLLQRFGEKRGAFVTLNVEVQIR